jgi:stage III sporulation protein AC
LEKIMDIDFIMKVAGIAMTVAVTCQILSRIGRDDQSALVSLAGIVAMLVVLFGEIAALFDTVRGIFGI